VVEVAKADMAEDEMTL